jgi:16S rRNA (cytidine1402-2'-O)-methyltransferase
MPGTLYVVATPIGNLQDMSRRAIETLGNVFAIACEDTRTTGKLLARWGIRTKTLSFHEHNEAQRAPKLIERLLEGKDIALVSDAGTPLISDPGYRLVRAATELGIPVRAVPGASAVLAALSVAGLPTSSFTFVGFVPARGAARTRAIDTVTETAGTVVLFEAPTRAARLLRELAEHDPERPGCLLREMTKLHEEHRHGSVAALAAWASEQRFKGELTVVLGPPSSKRQEVSIDSLAPEFQKLRDDGLTAREASKRLAREHGLPTRAIYNHFNR